jgi:hypothetical protein
LLRLLLAAAVFMVASTANAAPLDTVAINLDPLIDAAAKEKNRFAVDVPHVVRFDREGTWHQSGSATTWSYAIQVPSAVSLSFYAPHISLSRNAVLTVRGKQATYIYRTKDITRASLWSRIAIGDFLELQLTVPMAERRQIALEIRSFQAGYRGLGSAVPDHPHYARLKAQTRIASSSSCVQNYECAVTSGNTGPGQATVGLIIANLYQCSGTLLNDVPTDGTPFVLTARHCQNGNAGGGNPGAAGSVRILWDAVSACGQPLGTLYDPGIKEQDGATTVVEQQDAWLIQLDQSPIVSDSYYAGFDATGGAIVGGYSIHHALSYDKQLTDWYGQALAVPMSAGTLGVGYNSNFWEVVNQTGNIGPGSSGSALFDQNNHLVGVLSLGRISTDSSGYGACPVAPQTAPNGSNGVGDFTSLAAVWNSTADTTSTTGTKTFQQALDPQGTGVLTISGSAGGTPLNFLPSQLAPPVGTSLLLTWSAPNASSCTASGGVPGDNWNTSGSLPTAGTIPVGEAATGTVTYVLNCSFANGTNSRSQVTVTWTPATPSAVLALNAEVWTTRPAAVQWWSNVSPCSLNGGSTSLSNLPATGTTTVTEATPGTYNYTLTCGTGSTVATSQGMAIFVAPAVSLQANATDRRLGSQFSLILTAYADSCTPTGGAPNDGWATTQLVGAKRSYEFQSTVTTLGTYTYGVVCSSGALSASGSVTVSFENNPPYATLTADKTTVTNVESFTLTWKSNVDGCIGGGGVNPPLEGGSSWGYSSQGSTVEYPPNAGTYTLNMTCAPGNPVTSAPLVITVNDIPPTAALSALPTSITLGDSTTLTWSSTNAEGCTAGGNPGGGAWAGVLPTSGSQNVKPVSTGSFTATVTCGRANGEHADAQVTITVAAAPSQSPPPSASGGGGGGALGFDSIAMLSALLLWRKTRTRDIHKRHRSARVEQAIYRG